MAASRRLRQEDNKLKVIQQDSVPNETKQQQNTLLFCPALGHGEHLGDAEILSHEQSCVACAFSSVSSLDVTQTIAELFCML